MGLYAKHEIYCVRFHAVFISLLNDEIKKKWIESHFFIAFFKLLFPSQQCHVPRFVLPHASGKAACIITLSPQYMWVIYGSAQET